MSPTLLQQIVDANKSYLAGVSKSLDANAEPFVVVACIDPRLTCLLEPAMGLPRNRAVVVRTAGNRVCADDRDTQRSIATGLYIKRAAEVFIVGHTDCAMSKFSSAEVIESFRSAGVPRTAFGDEDLRSWFGAFGDIKSNVLESIQFLRRSGLVPSSVKIHGLVLDTRTGAVEVILDGDVASVDDLAIRPPEAEAAKPIQPPAAPVSRTPETAAKRPIVIEEDRVPAKPMSLREVTAALKTLVARERGRSEFQRNLMELAAALRDKRTARILSVLDQILSRYESAYPDLRPSLEALKSMIESKGSAEFNYIQFIKTAFE